MIINCIVTYDIHLPTHPKVTLGHGKIRFLSKFILSFFREVDLYRMGSSNYWNDPYSTENSSALGATVTSQGIISLRLHSGIQVDTTIDKGIRVLNSQVVGKTKLIKTSTYYKLIN